MMDDVKLGLAKMVVSMVRDEIELIDYRIDQKDSLGVHPRERFWHQQELGSLITTKRRLLALQECFIGKMLNRAVDVVALDNLAELLKSDGDEAKQHAVETARRLSQIAEEQLSKVYDDSKATQAVDKIIEAIKKAPAQQAEEPKA